MERTGSQLVLHICEELDHHTAGQISKVVDLQIEKGNVRTLIFDFSGITFMDSSGIGMVMGRHRKMNFLGGRTFVTGILECRGFIGLFLNIRKGRKFYNGKNGDYV